MGYKAKGSCQDFDHRVTNSGLQCSAGKKALPRKELFPAKTGTQTCIPSPIVPVAAIQYLNREWTEPLESSPLSAVVEAAP